jgi:adenosylcobinamide hydrolase
MVAVVVRDGIGRLTTDGARWLATGYFGGYHDAPAASNVTVPGGFERTDLDAYVADRLATAGFDAPRGPALLTAVAQRHARGARRDSVTVLATAGLTNPATLPLEPAGTNRKRPANDASDEPPAGTVNLLVHTTRALDDGTLATLLATAVEAKTATLQSAVEFTGTTSDAVVVGTDPDGSDAAFAGSDTAVGAATRACVRDALVAALDATGGEYGHPESVAAAEYGVVTDERTDVFVPEYD